MSETTFYSAVEAIFQNWSALQLTVSQCAAGPKSKDIAKWMVSATVQWFSENKDLECDEVEDFLTDIITQEFNVQFDDGSAAEVSKLVCEFFTLSTSPSCENEFKRRFEELPKCDLSKCQVDQEPSTDEYIEAKTDDGIKVPIHVENDGYGKECKEAEQEVDQEPIKDEHNSPKLIDSTVKDLVESESDKQDKDASNAEKHDSKDKEVEPKEQNSEEDTIGQETPFYSAVNSIFQNWTALQLMVSQGAAGTNSADIAKWMVSATVQWFSENKDLECDEVEDFLITIINQEFHVHIDDDSEKEVSKLVCEFYKLSESPECNDEFKRRLLELPKCDLSKCQVDLEPTNDRLVGVKTDDESNIPILVPIENNGDVKENNETESEEQDSDGCTMAKRQKIG